MPQRPVIAVFVISKISNELFNAIQSTGRYVNTPEPVRQVSDNWATECQAQVEDCGYNRALVCG